MSSPMWLVSIVKKTFPQRFMLARWSRYPVFGRIYDYLLFDGDDMTCLPRDRTINVNEEVWGGEEMVLPSRVLDHFIDKANYLWVMDTCICREATACKDYPIDLGCLFMGETAMGINPKMGRRVTREEAHEHIRKCREAGLFQIIGRNKLDTVWLNVRPGNRLLTVCNCCPCCCLWKILPVVSPVIGDKMRPMPGVKVTVTDACVGCGTCTEKSCFVDAIRVEGGQAVIGEECRGCGNCVESCPEGAIMLTIEDTTFMDSLVPRITSLVDVT